MRKFNLFFIILLATIITNCANSQQNNKQMIYKNSEIEIPFSGEYKIDSIKEYKSSGYFSKSTEHVLFCKQEPQPEYVQQVLSETGFLCSMYILPLLSDKKLKEEVEQSFKAEKALATLTPIEELKLGGHLVFKWRYRIGKTRLDHYMLKAKENFYLFVSSPYGSNGYIEDIISKTKVFK